MNILHASLTVTLTLALPAQGLTETERTEHFEIKYRAGSRAGAAVDRIAVLVERELARICSQLGIEVGGAYELHLYDDLDDLAETTGVQGSGGFSAGKASHVPYDNDQTRYHELVHIIAYQRLPKAGAEPRSLFFAEGLANACLEFVHGVPVHAVAKHYRDHDALPALAELTHTEDFYAWLRARPGFNAYDVAGSYLRFLLDEYGAAKTTKYYTGMSPRRAFGIDEAALETRWHAALDQLVLRPELEQLLDQRHRGAIELLAAQNAPAGLPADLLGDPEDWHTLLDRKLVPFDGAEWVALNESIVGSSTVQSWSVCELGEVEYRDCIVRATIETERPTPIQVRLGAGNQGMLVNGTFVYRGDRPAAHSAVASMTAERKTTDFVLVRRDGKLEVWIDGRKALTTDADPTPAVPGIAFHGGRVLFKNVRVRSLD